MFGMFKKKSIEAGRLEFLFVACISDKLRKSESMTPTEMIDAIHLWLKKGGFALSAEQSAAIQMACLNISLTSEAKNALKSMRLEDDHSGAQLRALRALLAKNQIFLCVD